MSGHSVATEPKQKTLLPVTSLRTGLLQRTCACGGNPGVDGECAECRGKRLQRKAITPLTPLRPTLTTHQGLLQRCGADGECAECRAKRLSMQRGPAAPAVSTPSVPPIVHDVLGSSGHSLDAGTRTFMEPRFGHDFSNVRVHTDAKAAESARAVNALAYTVGRNVVFGTGQYAPGTSTGQKLLAHELTHVVQQSGMSDSGRVQRQLEVGAASDPAEQEADAQAASVVDSPDAGKSPSQKQGGMPLEKPQHDISKAPKDMKCDISTGGSHLSGTDIFFDLASSEIPSKEDVKRTIKNRKEIDDFKASWTRTGSSDDVQVDGYASADGEQTFNWQLSCNRAEAVKDELSSVILANKITTVAHGETDEFSKTAYERNRHAIITRVPSPKPPPGPGPGPSAIKTVKVWLNAFIPDKVPGKTISAPAPYAGMTMLNGPIFSGCYLGDNRPFDANIHAPSRMHSEIEIDVTGPTETFQYHHCYETHEIDCTTGATCCTGNGRTSDMKFFNLRGSSATVIEVELEGASNNPCYTGSPDIDYEATVFIDVGERTVVVKAKIDEFPAFEMYAAANGGAGGKIFNTMPLPGKDPWNLPGGADRIQNGSTTI